MTTERNAVPQGTDLELYALKSDDIAEQISVDTATKLADIVSNGINQKNMMHVKNLIALSVATTIRQVYPIAEQEIENGITRYGARAFAMESVFRINLAEFYSRYIPVLAANMSVRNFLNIQNIIRQGEANGMSENAITDRIGQSYLGMNGNGKVIVRTEGTRAVSLARRAVAQRQAARGNAPEFYIYKSLMDSRTTKVCNFLHNRYWAYDDDDFKYWPPNHFHCRSGVVFAWRNTLLEDTSIKRLTPSSRMKANQLRAKQFPTWVQSGNDVLINPAASAADALTGRNTIRDDTDLARVLKENEVSPIVTRGNKALLDTIRDTVEIAKTGDTAIMQDVMKELKKIK